MAIRIELKPGTKEEWKSKWAVLAKHVHEHEPLTLAYEVLDVEGSPNELFVYERCVPLLYNMSDSMCRRCTLHP